MKDSLPRVDASALMWKWDDNNENTFEFVHLRRLVGSPEDPEHRVEVLWKDGSVTLESGSTIKRTASRAYQQLVRDWRATFDRAKRISTVVLAS